MNNAEVSPDQKEMNELEPGAYPEDFCQGRGGGSRF